MDFCGATQLAMVAEHLTKTIGHLGICHTELFIIFNFVVLKSLHLHLRRLLFMHKKLALEIRHFRHQLVLSLELKMLLILVSCCFTVCTSATILTS